jgi:hypothetical protein
MSYWIYLQDANGANVAVDRFTDGGTYPLGGETEAVLNVTYNYTAHFNFRSLNQQRAADTIPALEQAVHKLGINRDDDYWKPTEGNVGYTLNRLLSWAKLYPTGIWIVH